MNLKAIQADQAGRVFAAVKTSADGTPDATSADPQVLLLVLKPGTDAIDLDRRRHPGATATPVRQVFRDEEHSVVHVVATALRLAGLPGPGTIYDKSLPWTPVILAAAGRRSSVTPPRRTRTTRLH